jgi:hypothetical protein
MRTIVVAFRAAAALVLVLSLVAGLFSVQGMSAAAQQATPEVPAPAEPSLEPVVEPAAPSVVPSTEGEAIDGDAGANPGESTEGEGDSVIVGPIAEQAVELRARTQGAEVDDTIGTTEFEYNQGGFFPFEAGTSAPRAGATFQVLDDNGTIIQTVTTDANGAALLTVLQDDFSTVLDVESGDTTEIYYEDGDDTTRPILTATLIVAPDAIDDGSDLYTIAADQIELRARTIETSAGDAGVVQFAVYEQGGTSCTFPPESFECFILLCIILGQCPLELDVNAAQINDSAPAGGYRFQVVTTTGNGTPIAVVDDVTTGPDGVVLLDVPVGVPYVIREVSTGAQSSGQFTEAEDVQNGRTLVAAAITVPVTGGSNTNPDGETLPYAVATDNLELRLRYVQDPDDDGFAEFEFGDVEREGGFFFPIIESTDFENGDSIVAAGVSVTILDANNTVVDRGVTNELGEVLLDTPVQTEGDGGGIPIDSSLDVTNPVSALTGGTTIRRMGIAPPPVADGSEFYTILVEGYGASQPFTSPDVEDVAEGRDTITGFLFVDDLNDVIGVPSIEPSASGAPSDIAIPSTVASASGAPSDIAIPSTDPSAAPSDGGYDGEVIEGGATVTGLVAVDDERAGEFRYFIDLVEMTDAEDFLRYATEGEFTFEVLTVIDGEVIVIDSGETDENGVVVLDIPADVSYFIAATDDLAEFYGSDDIAAGQSVAVVAVAFITAGEVPSAAASASAMTSAVASASNGGGNGDDDDDDNGNGGSNNGGSTNGGTSNGGSSTGGGATGLPNTGAGATDSGMAMTWALMALMAVAGVVAAGLGLRRRNA